MVWTDEAMSKLLHIIFVESLSVVADEDCPALDVTAFCNGKVHVHKDCMWCYYFVYILKHFF